MTNKSKHIANNKNCWLQYIFKCYNHGHNSVAKSQYRNPPPFINVDMQLTLSSSAYGYYFFVTTLRGTFFLGLF